jgi:hypothetical protein
MSCSMEIIQFLEDCEQDNFIEYVVVEEDEDAPTRPLYVLWTKNESLTYQHAINEWDERQDYRYLATHEPMMPFVYKLSFKEFLIQLESDKNSMSHEDVFLKYIKLERKI